MCVFFLSLFSYISVVRSIISVNRLQSTTPTSVFSIRDNDIFSSPAPFRPSTKVQQVYNGHAHAQVIINNKFLISSARANDPIASTCVLLLSHIYEHIYIYILRLLFCRQFTRTEIEHLMIYFIHVCVCVHANEKREYD